MMGFVVVESPEMVMEEPNERRAPPDRPFWVLIVTEEFWSMVLVMEEAGREIVPVAVSAPTERIPMVEEPMYAWPAPNIVEVAEENVWTAVQVLALPRFKEATTSPVVGEMVRV
jgi:hypothetical protein